MDPSLFALAALVLIPAVQVPAVLYVARYVEVDTEELPDVPGYTSPPAEWGLDGEGADAEEERSAPAGKVACAQCGTENGPDFVYCWACTARLP